jgi:hypothetical protein
MPANFSFSTTDATRTCPHPEHEGERVLPFDSEHFYIRPNGSADYWCRDCVRRYNREQRRNRPQVTGRKFGVEMEVILQDRYALERELRSRGLDVYNDRYTHQVMNSWKIVTDASVMGGYELVSPPLSGRAGLDQLKKACAALAACGARVNRSCGLHVHHYADRYRSLNVAAFGRYGTVEVRQHQGTINFKKIAAWIAMGQAFVTWAKSDASVDSELTTDALLDRLGRHGLKSAQVSYLKDRAAHFAGVAVAA